MFTFSTSKVPSNLKISRSAGLLIDVKPLLIKSEFVIEMFGLVRESLVKIPLPPTFCIKILSKTNVSSLVKVNASPSKPDDFR